MFLKIPNSIAFILIKDNDPGIDFPIKRQDSIMLLLNVAK